MDGTKPEWLQQMEGILEGLNEGVIIFDDCHAALYANECIVEMTGFTRDEIIGATPAKFYSGDDLVFIMKQISRGDMTGRNRYELFAPRKDGQRTPVIISSRVIEDPDGRRFEIVTFTDISEQKRAEAELRAANAQLEKRQHEIETELALAARVQQSLAPQCMRWGSVAVETFYLPVRTIGGDFGLVVPRGDDSLSLFVCDVSGHGIGSALVANRIYTETLSLLERRTPVGDMLRRLNDLVLRQIRTSGFYFTLAAAQLGPRGRRMHFAGAGHPPAIWVTPSGEVRLLEAQSAVLGALEGAVADEPSVEVDLDPGDRIALYTDGLTEVFDHRGEMLGIEGFQEIVRANAKKSLPEMKQAVLDEVSAWRHGPPTDDISLVLVEIS